MRNKNLLERTAAVRNDFSAMKKASPAGKATRMLASQAPIGVTVGIIARTVWISTYRRTETPRASRRAIGQSMERLQKIEEIFQEAGLELPEVDPEHDPRERT